MKTQIKKELHSKSITELEKMLSDNRTNLQKLNLDHQMGKLKNTSSLRGSRLEIAVIKTIINEKRAVERIVHSEKSDEQSKGGKR